MSYALQNRFAFPSSNVCNLETARAVVAAAEAEDAPIMLQSYFGDLYYGGLDVFPKLLRILAEQTRVSGVLARCCWRNTNLGSR